MIGLSLRPSMLELDRPYNLFLLWEASLESYGDFLFMHARSICMLVSNTKDGFDAETNDELPNLEIIVYEF